MIGARDKEEQQVAELVTAIKDNNDLTGIRNTEEEEDLLGKLNRRYFEQEYNHKEEKHRLSISYFKLTLWFIAVYIACVLAVIVFVGLGYLRYDASVINIFLGTTSIHVIGLGYVAMRWLFPNTHRYKQNDIRPSGTHPKDMVKEDV